MCLFQTHPLTSYRDSVGIAYPSPATGRSYIQKQGNTLESKLSLYFLVLSVTPLGFKPKTFRTGI